MKKSRVAGLVLAVVLGAFGLAAALTGPSAVAQSSDDPGRRLDRVERELRALQRKVFGSPGEYGAAENAGDSGAQRLATDQRITALEQQLSQLTGEIEETNHRADQTGKKLDAFMKDAEFRFQQLEKGGAGGAIGGAMSDGLSGSSPQPAPDNGETRVSTPGSGGMLTPPGAQSAQGNAKLQLPPGSALEQYNYARKLLDQGDYPGAASAFQAFIQAHGNDDLVGNSYYWLGRAYFLQDQYKQAAGSFLDGYKKFPKGVKAPDSLLSLGVSLAAMNQKAEACQTFAAVTQQYPGVNAATKARLADEKKKAGCK